MADPDTDAARRGFKFRYFLALSLLIYCALGSVGFLVVGLLADAPQVLEAGEDAHRTQLRAGRIVEAHRRSLPELVRDLSPSWWRMGWGVEQIGNPRYDERVARLGFDPDCIVRERQLDAGDFPECLRQGFVAEGVDLSPPVSVARIPADAPGWRRGWALTTSRARFRLDDSNRSELFRVHDLAEKVADFNAAAARGAVELRIASGALSLSLLVMFVASVVSRVPAGEAPRSLGPAAMMLSATLISSPLILHGLFDYAHFDPLYWLMGPLAAWLWMTTILTISWLRAKVVEIDAGTISETDARSAKRLTWLVLGVFLTIVIVGGGASMAHDGGMSDEAILRAVAPMIAGFIVAAGMGLWALVGWFRSR